MKARVDSSRAFSIALLLASVAATAEPWELRPAASDVPGTAQIEAGQIDDAIRVLTLELESNGGQTHLALIGNLCVAHAIKLEYVVAMRYCDRAVGQSSPSITALNNRGVLRAVTGDYRGAIQDFQRAERMDNCGQADDCDENSVQALVRRNLARAKERESSS